MSPIKGLTDRGLSFPEIGQVRKGAKKTAKRPGKDLEWFRVEFDEKELETADLFQSIYGVKPTEINVILPFDDIERCWEAYLEAYTKGRMVARSDGLKFTYLVDTESGEIKVKNGEPFTPYKEGEPVGKDYEGKPVYANPVGRLKVIVPELGRAAYLVVMTTSVHDIGNISAQLEAFKHINGGVIKGIPLVLRRRPKMISVPKEDGQRMRVEKWMLSIEADPAWVRAKLDEIQDLPIPVDSGALLPGEHRDLDEIVEGEELKAEIQKERNLSQEEVEGISAPVGKLSLESAMAVTNRDGVKYGDLDTEKLAHMRNSLQTALSKDFGSHPSIEEFETRQYKLDAIRVILADREGK